MADEKLRGIFAFAGTGREVSLPNQTLCDADCSLCSGDLTFLRRGERPAYEQGSPELTSVDLFSGCGGMSLGIAEAARRAGAAMETALAVDCDPLATEVFANNFTDADVRTAGVEELFDGEFGAEPSKAERAILKLMPDQGVDILIGGPPCQGHSDLNNWSRRNDPRNELYLRMARAAEILTPTMVMIENVPSVRHSEQGVVQAVNDHLNVLGYDVAEAILDVSELGVPQSRKRHILLAIMKSELCLSAADALANSTESTHTTRTVGWAINDLHGREGISTTDFDAPSRASATNKERMAWFFEDPQNRYDLPNALRPPCHRDKKHTYNSVYGRLRWDAPAQTITTGFTSMGQGRYVHPKEPRTLTPHEAARIQGFPDFFTFELKTSARRTAWSKLIGNAVPPKLSMAVALPVLRAIVVARSIQPLTGQVETRKSRQSLL